ncbi:STAS domain-containing protein [Actinoplanes sp. NBC_00393]|uniref:STAS domain-containing protein n=1 Tax=Actinoplanes sp. NBC_00393 TaxID=2975953 RepID=UPI002E1DD892
MFVEQIPGSRLGVQVTRSGPVLVCVAVSGELVSDTAGVLAEQVRATLVRQQPDTMLLNLAQLEFIDVAGVHTLYELHTAAATRDCTLIIRNASRPTRWILSALGLDALFPSPARRRPRAEPGS